MHRGTGMPKRTPFPITRPFIIHECLPALLESRRDAGTAGCGAIGALVRDFPAEIRASRQKLGVKKRDLRAVNSPGMILSVAMIYSACVAAFHHRDAFRPYRPKFYETL